MSSRSLLRGRMQEIAAVVPPVDVDTVGMGCTDFTVAAWVRTVSIAFPCAPGRATKRARFVLLPKVNDGR